MVCVDAIVPFTNSFFGGAMSLDFLKAVDPSIVVLAAAGAAGGLHRGILGTPKDGEKLGGRLVRIGISVLLGSITSLVFGPVMAPVIPAAIHAIPWAVFANVFIPETSAFAVGGFLAGLLGIGLSDFAITFTREFGRLLVERVKREDKP